ncbi:LysM peptidoglycan-binding domain-containing protein [Alkaliphilus peptidifermentans]|uniref:LysM domain-containing protein n=1 Tax=Alkaliphilus peptidifermentans DSM 18978 TaxID=1120976 RepID=A0A1G5EWH0_9FIRM|nr:LysM domain-containing protein [Alkaliphilus peptidifermentans]SCY31333.1 LysM domain-containing protein [Alkaliphilus peptidifermentans DSM 18978]
MASQMYRIPVACPTGFKGRYTVTPGDTMFIIAQIFRVPLDQLINVNPHIINPDIIYPGDVLCVPGLVTIPCCVILKSQGRVPFATGGVGFANFGPRGGQVINVMATLPPPSYFGAYDIYIATAFFRDIGGFGNQMFPSPEIPPTWATRIELPTALTLSPDVQIVVQPSNSITGISGPMILTADLLECNLC